MSAHSHSFTLDFRCEILISLERSWACRAKKAQIPSDFKFVCCVFLLHFWNKIENFVPEKQSDVKMKLWQPLNRGKNLLQLINVEKSVCFSPTAENKLRREKHIVIHIWNFFINLSDEIFDENEICFSEGVVIHLCRSSKEIEFFINFEVFSSVGLFCGKSSLFQQSVVPAWLMPKACEKAHLAPGNLAEKKGEFN